MNNTIITIARESGSGGGEVARMLGHELGLKVYNRPMIDKLVEHFNMSVAEIEKVRAQRSTWWSDICRFYKQFGTLSYEPGQQIVATPESIYHVEEHLLRAVAEEESCIIIGRAANYVFRDHPGAIRVLLMADRDERIGNIMKYKGLSEQEAADYIDRVDRDRDTFVRTVSGVSRYDARGYDFSINITGQSHDAVVQFLADNVRLWNRYHLEKHMTATRTEANPMA